ncbi:MAG: nucleotidyltransferase family protein [Prevotella sp.]|nr:nucleotidyltransferase family protein [Prevotella sp.]
MNEDWIRFLQFCVNEDVVQPDSVEDIDWESLLLFMRKQSMAGVLMFGVSKLKNVKIPRPILMKMFLFSEKVRKRNELLFRKSADVAAKCQNDGFTCCILKGQGNAMMYSDPYVRTSGDIDVWVKGARAKLIEYARNRYPKATVRYDEITYKEDKVNIELHPYPCIMNNPFYNRRLQYFFSCNIEKQCNHYVELPDNLGRIPIPTAEFNVIFQLAHIMRHFFDEGIGLRQLLDYFYVLRLFKKDIGDDDQGLLAVQSTLRNLGMYKFAGAVMFVMKEIFRLEDEFLIAPVDERRGRTLLTEILRGGNFGHYSGLRAHSTGGKFFAKVWRNLHFAREYPAEALCEPIFRTWHFFWRLKHTYSS